MPLRIAPILMVGTGTWEAAWAPHRSCQRASSVLWAEGAQEESRMGMAGRRILGLEDRLQLSQ